MKRFRDLFSEDTDQVSDVKVDVTENAQDEKRMMRSQLMFMAYAAKEIASYLDRVNDPEEWYQNKMATTHSMMKTLYSYAQGQKQSMDADDDLMAGYYGEDNKLDGRKKEFKEKLRKLAYEKYGKKKVDQVDESTKAYAASLEKIANDKKLKAITPKDREMLAKLADLMKKEGYRKPTAAEIAADKKKDGKKPSGNRHSRIKKKVYGNMMGGLKEQSAEFKPHYMYSPSGEKKFAKTEPEHLALKKKGWGHEEPVEQVDERMDRNSGADGHSDGQSDSSRDRKLQDKDYDNLIDLYNADDEKVYRELINLYGYKPQIAKKTLMRNNPDIKKITDRGAGVKIESVEQVDEAAKHKLLQYSKLSGTEYQKAKKLKGFNKSDYKWNPDEQLYYHKNYKVKEGVGFIVAEAKIDKSSPMYKEYQDLKKMPIKQLRNKVALVNRGDDVRGYDKEGAVAEILRAKYGNKKVDKVFGFSEGKEQLDEANFKPGNLKLKDGSKVKISMDDAKAITAVMKTLSAKNRKEMETRLMSDKKGFDEIMAFVQAAGI